MGIRYGLLALFFMVAVKTAFGDEQGKKRFDDEQTERLKRLQVALAKGDKESARRLAKEQSTEIALDLQQYESFGPHQREAASRLAAAIMSSDVVNEVLGYSEHYSGQDAEAVLNFELERNYGFILEYDASKKQWKPVIAGDRQKALAKVKEVLSKRMSFEIWKAFTPVTQNEIALGAIEKMAEHFKDIPASEPKTNEEFLNGLKKKSDELGNADKGLVAKLKKEVSAAQFNDVAEKRLLTAQKYATDALLKKDASEDLKLEDFCSGFASKLSNREDIRRRMNGTDDEDPCYAPLKKRLASVDRSPAVLEEPGEAPLLTAAALGDEAKKKEDDPKDEGSGKDDKKRKKTDRKKTDELIAAEQRAEELNRKAEQLEDALANSQARENDMAQRLNMSMQCQRGAGTNNDPFGFTLDNKKNEKILESIKEKMEKVLTDNMSAAVCEMAETHGMQAAASMVLDGMGVPLGPMTVAQQKTAMGVSQRAIEQVGKFAKNRSTRLQLMAQLEETASKRALNRFVVEYGNYINQNTIAYLKNRTHRELVGVDGMGLGSPLALAAVSPNESAMVVQIYNDLYETSLMDLTRKYGEGEDYVLNAECALVLAQEAASRWSSEAGRMASLVGPSRQNAFNNLRGTLGMTMIRNAPSSENKPKRNYRAI